MSTALLVGFVLALLWFFEKLLGTPMITRPIIVSTAVGFVLGDIQKGIMIGASLELVFMGAIQIGGSIPPDVLVGAGLGTTFAILSNRGPEVALTLALPISMLAQSIKALIFIIRSWMMGYAVEKSKQADISKMKMLNIIGLLIQSLMYFTVGFIAVSLGATIVGDFVDKIPENIMNALTNIGKLLPAVGFALLLQPMMTTKNMLYFLFGFLLLSYLELPIMAITLIGIILAFIIVFEEISPSSANIITVSNENDDSSWEDLFDD